MVERFPKMYSIIGLSIVFFLIQQTTTAVDVDSNKTLNGSAPYQCGKSNPSGVRRRVVAGHTALPGAWPWQAILLYGYRKRFICSGALIHPSWVLTAAHCVRSTSPTMYKIRLGDFDRSRYEGREQTIGVEKVITHPKHDIPVIRNNDLALIKLSKPAILNQWVGTVCLPTADDYLHKDLRCYATGWGMTERSNTYSRMLQQAHVPLVTKYTCRRRANRWYRYGWYGQHITHEMLCGGDDNNGASTCMGDSGGPYVCRNPQGYWVLQGITSWGSRSCRVSDRYSVFTKVQVFTEWIKSMMNTPKKKVPEEVKKITVTSEDRSSLAMLRLLKKWLRLLMSSRLSSDSR